MTVLQFRNASREHAMGAFGVAIGAAMVIIGNLVPSLSLMADGGNVLAVMSFVGSLAKRGEKTAAQSVATLDSKLDQRLAGQTNVIKDNTETLLNNLAGTTLQTVSTVRTLEKDRDAHAGRLDGHDAKNAEHDAKHAEHAAAISDHGEVLDNYGDHIKVMNDGLQRVAKETGVQYQPGGVLKARAKPA